MLSILYGILSAATWGAADFIGGLASKRTSPYRVLFLAEIAGLIPFTALALLTRESIPPIADMLLGAGSSLLGLGGLLLLYRALADGQMTIAAPVSALFAALVPVIFGFFALGAPASATLIGFGFAFLAVWFISQTNATNWRSPLPVLRSFADLRLPLLSGIFFGLYFIILDQATRNSFFWPLVAARFAGIVAFGLYALLTRQPALPPRNVWGLCLINGMIDIGGNAFFVLAAHTGRIDVAAVLGALYPASTVLLAWIFLKERLTWLQAFGVLLAFVAIVLFTL
ncbi:MAG TPA: DMT family transporter [Anaerolineales bacterium]|nr:DMT family transporter [Anaerolineales bacterium]